MSNLLNKLKPSSHKNKDEGHHDQSKGEEQQFSIQPHPAVRLLSPACSCTDALTFTSSEQKTNNPGDLEPPQPGGGLNSNPEWQAHNNPGPYIPSQGIRDNVEQPKVSGYSRSGGFVSEWFSLI